jgi:signal transduction histidine kinase
MDERVRLVKGTIAIDSKLNHGTHIHARIPMKPDYVARRAAG